MKRNFAKTAILLATYNGEKYLPAQLDSLFSQTDSDWALYVHDDGSNDATCDILSRYREKYPEWIINPGVMFASPLYLFEPTRGGCGKMLDFENPPFTNPSACYIISS